MSNHPCGLCGTLHFNFSCPQQKTHEDRINDAIHRYCTNCGKDHTGKCDHDHDNYAIVVCDPKRGSTARDCEGFTRATNEAHEVMRGFHDEVVVKHHHDPLGKLKSFAFYYRKGVLVAVIAPSKKVGL